MRCAEMAFAGLILAFVAYAAGVGMRAAEDREASNDRSADRCEATGGVWERYAGCSWPPVCECAGDVEVYDTEPHGLEQLESTTSAHACRICGAAIPRGEQ